MKSELTSVKLEKFKQSDTEEFYRIAKNDGTKKFVKLFYPENLDEAQKIVEMFTEDSNYVAFKILDESGAIVGAISGEKKGKGRMEVSYFTSPRFRKNGYCTSAVKLFEIYLKENTRIKEIYFQIASNNKASKNVMQRLSVPLAYVRMYNVYVKKIK